MLASCHLLLLSSAMLVPTFVHGEDLSWTAATNKVHKRLRREWIWNKMHISEEKNETLPHHVGRIISSIQNSNAMYVLEGDGANSIFKVDENTGDVSAYERLDREKKAEYQLTAHILDRTTNKSLEPPSKFRIIVQDVNDNAPIFVQRVFNGSVFEMSPVGTSVTTVTAVDADDPTLLGYADVDYKVIKGQNYFRIDKSGVIRTAAANLDREQKATYEIVVQAIDGKGLQAAESGTATVRITLIDINDNSPVFNPTKYQFEVLENITLNGEVGKLTVEDIDEPQNRNTKYSFASGNFQDTFLIIPKPYTNEGIIKPKKPLDFEKTSSYQFSVEATDGDISYANSKTKGSKSIATVSIRVIDVDEPPVFNRPSYMFEVVEGSDIKKAIGFVSAIDPDRAKREIRYRVLRSNYFKISNNGAIFAERILDREEHSWHNITVAANEIENGKILPQLETHAQVFIKVRDINDNAPQFTEPYQPGVCENAAPGKVIIRISAVDKDEMFPGLKFTYSLISDESNFTLIDNHDNTANITVKYGEFNRELVKTHYLPILISDNGLPPQSSTNTLSIHVCKCNEAGEFTFCEEAAKQMGVSVQALVAIFVCILTIFVIVLLIALRRRHKKDLNVLRKNVAEIHEQLVAYDEEGGGEMDTTSYDVSILNSVRQSSMTSPRMTQESRPCVYSQVQKPPRHGLSGTGEMAIMIEMKKDEADNDGDLLPYDTLHIFGYEGAESIAESLSSLGSGSSDSDIDYDFLNDWGPRFKMLAELYGLEGGEDFAY
ncbi:cadherin-5 [Eublepharis macularius]|uniref:Cadherin-5 n=1 Tax=Eublepharis macularius TaxID=481883 RepID=A0AA97KIF8_EUBMA|nr:cadherin-5 [Eublepharis macularius]